MRFKVQFRDRVGIAQEILAVLAKRRINVTAVEVDPPCIYIDAPLMEEDEYSELQKFLESIEGVVDLTSIELLPGEGRRLQLEALLASLDDPVLAVNHQGKIMAANPAAASAAEMSESSLSGRCLRDILDEPSLQNELIRQGFRVSLREITLRGKSYLLDLTPIHQTYGEPSKQIVGGVLILQTPRRVGARLQAMQISTGGGFEDIIGESKVIDALKARAARLATVDAALMVRGETGTGKELLAHACHMASSRRAAPFLALNCAALPENLMESELFGYAAGAFTGAQRGGRPGLLEMAHNGCIFLDEIGEMSAYLQAKLLRFLNDGSFRRVGGNRELQVDVRVISATHRNLEEMVTERTFREDLFYRLNVLQLEMPPLRERGEDILLLARHFLQRASAQIGRSACVLTSAAQIALMEYSWPGNVRQLHNVLFRAAANCDQSVLDVVDLELEKSTGQKPKDIPSYSSWEEAISQCEKELLKNLYPRYPSSRKLAAQLKTSHTMIANKLRQYGIYRK